jgi:hypothetical protein
VIIAVDIDRTPSALPHDIDGEGTDFLAAIQVRVTGRTKRPVGLVVWEIADDPANVVVRIAHAGHPSLRSLWLRPPIDGLLLDTRASDRTSLGFFRNAQIAATMAAHAVARVTPDERGLRSTLPLVGRIHAVATGLSAQASSPPVERTMASVLAVWAATYIGVATGRADLIRTAEERAQRLVGDPGLSLTRREQARLQMQRAVLAMSAAAMQTGGAASRDDLDRALEAALRARDLAAGSDPGRAETTERAARLLVALATARLAGETASVALASASDVEMADSAFWAPSAADQALLAEIRRLSTAVLQRYQSSSPASS